MMEDIQVKCDECEKEFTLETKTAEVLDGVEWIYFECPNCNEKYHCGYQNEKIQELQEECKQWQEKVKNPHLRKKALKKMEKLTEEISVEIVRLKTAHRRTAYTYDV